MSKCLLLFVFFVIHLYAFILAKSVLVPVQTIVYLVLQVSYVTLDIQVLPKYLNILQSIPMLYACANSRHCQVIAEYMSWLTPVTSLSFLLVSPCFRTGSLCGRPPDTEGFLSVFIVSPTRLCAHSSVCLRHTQ